MKQQLIQKFTATYGRPPAVITRAPGRLEFIGNHTDYNGGTVLGAAIDRSIYVAAAPADHGKLRFTTALNPTTTEIDPANPARQTAAASWVNYPLGVWLQFPKFNLRQTAALDYYADSDLPPGSGLSSSAAIELASALAYAALANENPDRETIVKLGRAAENEFVGVPCGILDQACSGFGKTDHLVFIDCRGPHFSTVPMPAGAHFWIFNTHTKHALTDGLYAARHRECMEAAKTLGIQLLADGTLSQLEANKDKLEKIPYLRARHILEEIERVEKVRAALADGNLSEVGKLLTASHRSSQNQFENSTPELDHLVDTLIQQPNVYGARLSGGGFGGAMMALTNADYTQADAEQAAENYRQKFGESPAILHLKAAQGAEIL